MTSKGCGKNCVGCATTALQRNILFTSINTEMANLRKDERVTLENESLGKMEFTAEHAETILAAANNTGPGAWALPKGSKYETENGKLIRSATATTDSGPAK